MLKKIYSILLIAALILGAAACSKQKNDTGISASYTIESDFDAESMTVRASMAVDITNNTDKELGAVKFNMYGNAFRQDAKIKPVSYLFEAAAYPDGKSYGNMQITAAYENGEIAPFSVLGADNNVLEILLEKSLFPGEQTLLGVNFILKLAKINHRTGYSDKAVVLGNWFPVLAVNTASGWYECAYYSAGDPFFSECADYNVSFRAPKSYVVAATGALEGITEEGEHIVYEYTAPKVRDFALVLSKDFNITSAETGGVQVNYYYLDDETPDVSLKAALESLEYFSEKFGKYPYSALAVAQVPFCYGGMEYPGLTVISDTLSQSAHIDTIVHENAHQWWYALVGSNQAQYGWLDEGLASYSALMFFESYPEYGISAEEKLSAAREAYRAFYAQFPPGRDTTMSRHIGDFSGDFEYINIAYNKSLLMFDGARRAAGDKKFVKALYNYAQQHAFLIAAPEDMIGCFEKTKINTTQYFYAWIDGEVII